MESILIIDEEENARNALSLIFKSDYTVLVADNIQKATELISIGRPDIILTELLDQKPEYLEQLIDMLGAAPKEQSRGETAFEIPIIVLTNISELPVAVEAMKLGICDYITKPYDTERIKTAVQNALQQRAKLKSAISDDELIESSVLFHGYLRYLEMVKNFSRLVNATYNPPELIPQITVAISEALETNRCILFLYDESAEEYFIEPRDAMTFDAVIGKDQPVLCRLRAEKRPMFRRELTDVIPEDDMLERCGAEDIHLLAPMLAKEELVGVIALGEKYNHAKYNQADLKLLSTIAQQSAFALKSTLYRQKLSENNAYLKTLLDNTGSALIVVDNQGDITLFNKEAQDLTGYPGEMILTKKTDLLGVEFASAIHETYETGQAKSRFETQLNTKDGAKLPVGLNAVLLRNGDKKTGVIVTFALLTETKRAEEVKRLDSRLAIWNDIAKQLAHELRNPLVSIKICAQLLPERYQDEKFREEYPKLVNADVERITNLLDKLDQLTRPISLSRQYHDVNVILSKAVSQAKREHGRTDVDVVVDYDENLPQILVDQDWLVAAFQNIIKNCMAYIGEEENELKIRTSVKEKMETQADIIVEILYHRTPASEQFRRLNIEDTIQLAMSDKIIKEHHGIVSRNNDIPSGLSQHSNVGLSLREESDDVVTYRVELST